MNDKMNSYLVLGYGVGKAVADYLRRQPDTDLVAIADKDPAVLRLGQTIERTGSARCEYLISDIDQLNASELFKNFDVIISALPASKNLALAKAAIEVNKGFCDLGGVLDITQEQIKQLNRLAIRNNVSVIPDCGLMPGLGILMARKLVYELKGTRSIKIYVGGLPQKPRPPLFYQRVYNDQGHTSICYDNSPILKDGQIVELPPFSDYEEIFVPELRKFSKKFDGQIEAFVTAGASIAPWTFKKFCVDLEEIFEKTVRWPNFVNFVRNIPREKFIEKISPHISIPVTEEDPDLVWLKVQASGYTKSGQHRTKSYSMLNLYDPETGLTAMEQSTGIPTAIIARMMANGQSRTGVNTPETAFSKKQMNLFWEEINKYFEIKSS